VSEDNGPRRARGQLPRREDEVEAFGRSNPSEVIILRRVPARVPRGEVCGGLAHCQPLAASCVAHRNQHGKINQIGELGSGAIGAFVESNDYWVASDGEAAGRGENRTKQFLRAKNTIAFRRLSCDCACRLCAILSCHC
jgi:hypothetical protein